MQSEQVQPGIWERCNTIEECYEFMLAYAAKGVPGGDGSKQDAQVREFLQRAVNAIARLVESCTLAVEEAGLEPDEKYQAFFGVIDRDARDAIAAMELVLGQPVISSQLLDNLNASVHLRALLTDVFLIGEVLRSRLSSKAIR